MITTPKFFLRHIITLRIMFVNILFWKSVGFIVLCGILCHKRSGDMAWEDDIEEKYKMRSCWISYSCTFDRRRHLRLQDQNGVGCKNQQRNHCQRRLFVWSAVQNGTAQADIKQKRTGVRKKIQKLLSHRTTGERVSRLCNKKVSTYFCRSRQSDKRMWFRCKQAGITKLLLIHISGI